MTTGSRFHVVRHDEVMNTMLRLLHRHVAMASLCRVAALNMRRGRVVDTAAGVTIQFIA